MSGWDILTDLVILLAIASICGVIAERMRLSAIVGAIVGGIIAGPGLLGLVHHGQVELQAVAEFGVALLLFTIGLEITRESIVEFGRRGALAGILQIVLTMGVAMAVAWLIGWGMRSSIALGAMAALSSTAAVARTLTDSGQLDSQHGRTALGMLIVQDLAIVPLVILVTAVGQPGPEPAEVASELGRTGGNVLMAVLLIVMIVVLLVPVLLRSSHISGNRELPVVVAVVTAVLSAWLAHAIGLSPALGAFVAGVALANSPFSHQIRADVLGFKAILLTLFFAIIGTLTNVAGLLDPERLMMVIGLALVVVIGKAVLGAVAVGLTGVQLGTSAAAGLCIAQLGEFSFVIGGVARSRGLIDEETLLLFVDTATVTLLLVPLLSAGATGIAAIRGRRGDGPDGNAALSGHVVIVGAGPSARGAVRALRDRAIDIAVIDLNDRSAASLRMEGIHALVGDARHVELLQAAGVDRARLVVVSLPDPVAAMTVISQVRTLAAPVRIVARARYNRSEHVLRQAGADDVVLEEDAVGTLLGEAVVARLDAQD